MQVKINGLTATGFWDDLGNALTATEVVSSFINNMFISYGSKAITDIYHQEAKKLIEAALHNNIRESSLAITIMATTLGNCPTPIAEVLEQNALGTYSKEGEVKDPLLDWIIQRNAVEQRIKGLGSVRTAPESIEIVNGASNAIFLNNAHEHSSNRLKILGSRIQLPSKTPNIDFAFRQLKGPVIKEILELCCITDEHNQPIPDTEGNYQVDHAKLKALKDQYLAGLGKVSFKEKWINEFENTIRLAIPENFYVEDMYDPEVKQLMASFFQKMDELRMALAGVEDDQVKAVVDDHITSFEIKVEAIQGSLKNFEKAKQKTIDMLQKINSDAFDATLGVTVDLSGHQLTTYRLRRLLPQLSVIMPFVTKLKLGGNQLEELPTGLFEFHKLTSLDIGNNQLQKLPDGLGKLESLKYLILKNNKISALPGGIGNLSKLTILDVRDNGLTILPKEMEQLKSLRTLHLGGNTLDNSSMGILDNLSVRNLDIPRSAYKPGNRDKTLSVSELIGLRNSAQTKKAALQTQRAAESQASSTAAKARSNKNRVAKRFS